MIGLARALHDALDLPELTTHLHDHRTRSPAYGFHGHGGEEVGNQAANEQADDDGRVGQRELDHLTTSCQEVRFEVVGVVSEQHEGSESR